jgi:hypothetical protein
MKKKRYQVLLGGLNDDQARGFVLSLTPHGVDFHRVPWSADLAQIASQTGFEAIIIAFPDVEPSLDEMLEEVRAPGSLSRHAGIVVLGRGRQLTLARWFVGRGVSRVVSADDPDETVRDTVLGLLDVAERFEIQAPVDVTVAFETGTMTTSCLSENISTSGMLLRCGREIPVGSTLSFAMSVPGEQEPISGQARVARNTDPEREGIEGFGAAFLSFIDADQTRLEEALARQSW